MKYTKARAKVVLNSYEKFVLNPVMSWIRGGSFADEPAWADVFEEELRAMWHRLHALAVEDAKNGPETRATGDKDSDTMTRDTRQEERAGE